MQHFKITESFLCSYEDVTVGLPSLTGRLCRMFVSLHHTKRSPFLLNKTDKLLFKGSGLWNYTAYAITCNGYVSFATLAPIFTFIKRHTNTKGSRCLFFICSLEWRPVKRQLGRAVCQYKCMQAPSDHYKNTSKNTHWNLLSAAYLSCCITVWQWNILRHVGGLLVVR